MPRVLFYAVLALQLASVKGAEPQQVQIEGAHFVGAAGCKSSSCHGGAGEKRSQYITWLRHDVHTRGYAILTTARSERMADALRLPQQQEGLPRATASARCTSCHSPFKAVPPARLLATADPAESVSCESCHGAAEPWLRGHTRPDWTYATRIGAGMRDLKSFYVRANTCVACHQNIEADIAGAGHPELFFELNRQSEAEPKHWRDPEGSGARAWLVGQAVALRELSWKLAQNPARDALTFSQWSAVVWLLHKTAAVTPTLPAIDSYTDDPGAFPRLQQQSDALARRAASANFDRNFAPRLLRELSTTAEDFRESTAVPKEIQYRRAQRLVLAFECLAGESSELRSNMSALREELRDVSSFDSNRFSARLAALQQTLH